jgi:hypothetical protein
MKKYNFGFAYWKEPTPVIVRRVSGAFASAGIAGCGFAYLRDNIPLAIALLTCAVVGSFISKLFADKP